MHDHRKLGRELELFDTDPLIGTGLPYWLPAGAAVRHALEEYLRQLERLAGYQHVYSPVLAKRELYEMSGHWSHYREGMYPPMELGGEQVVLRPSLCPHHALLFRSRGRSYRELPLRLAELGGQYRAELSGVLGGLTRVRAMQLTDAHIFCAPEQAADEARAALAMIRQAYAALGIEPVRYRLSLPGAGNQGAGGTYVGDPGSWEKAAAMLAGILDESGLDWEAGEGEAAFYGPKIDVQVADASEREATLSTVQIDFYQPAQFDLRYTGADGVRHRPVMVHRSVLGSMQRAVACLTALADRDLTGTILGELHQTLAAAVEGLGPGWDERFLATRRLIATEPALLAYVEHDRGGIKTQMIDCLAGKLDLDPEDLRLHVLAELIITAWSVSGRHWVRHGGQGGRRALIERLDGAVRAIPASLDLAARG